jgi:ABC-type phosphate/phosphonate transport system substrate-binding protein
MLQNILLGMDGDPAGRSALDNLGFDRFVLVKDSDYDSVRALEQKVIRR